MSDVKYSISHEDVTVTLLDLEMGTGAARVYEIRKTFGEGSKDEDRVYLDRDQAIFLRDALTQALAPKEDRT